MRSMRFLFHTLAAAGWSLLCSLRCSILRLHSLALSPSAWMDSTACDTRTEGALRMGGDRAPHPHRRGPGGKEVRGELGPRATDSKSVQGCCHRADGRVCPPPQGCYCFTYAGATLPEA